MKKMLTRFAESVLLKEQMKKVTGGAMVHCSCNNGKTITTDTSASEDDVDDLCGAGGASACVAVDV